MIPNLRYLTLAAILAAALAPDRAFAAPVVPSEFVVEDVAFFSNPTCVAFIPDGRMIVGEQSGAVFLVTNGVKLFPPLWFGAQEVLREPHLGIMSVAVDPEFFLNHYVYFLYTVDPDSNGVDTERKGFGRLVRYQMSTADTNTLDLSTRTILMGVDWAHGPLVDSELHSVGAIRFGEDGSLLVSIGDGGNSAVVDAGGLDSTSFQPGRTDTLEDIGAFRAQYLGSLCGKLLRLDRATGRGLPDNPFYDGDPNSVASRVWQYGLRMPFRFTVRPGSGSSVPTDPRPGSLYIGDVGWFSWEEINVAREGGHNFGWPCFEGPGPNLGYQEAQPEHSSCATIGGPFTFPWISWSQEDPALSNPPGIWGNCSMNGVFYSGDRYPESYRGRYFFSDFGGSWLRAASVDSADQLIGIEEFGTGLQGPVDFAVHPISGDIHFVSFFTSSVRRLRYAGAPNQSPIAVAAATSSIGHPPMEVVFSSTGSYDPDGTPVQFLWSFGDGAISSSADPTHTYASAGSFEAVLSVADAYGGVGRDTLHFIITGPNRFPVTPILDDFNRENGPIGGSWVDKVSTLVVLDSAITQNGAPAPSALWGDTPFGPDQEAHITLSKIVPSCRRYSLRLKSQGTTSADGAIEVRYDQTLEAVQVTTFDPGVGTRLRGTLNPVTLANGDRLGARAFVDGVVQVFRNDEKLGEVSLGDWAFRAAGGYIGLNLAGASGSRLDDFGGGSVFAGVNSAPVAVIQEPNGDAFFANGTSVTLRSASHDTHDALGELTHDWLVELLHNGHAQTYFTSSQIQDQFVMSSDSAGIGAVYRVWLRVHDTGGLSDTTQHFVLPEIDLTPTRLGVTPEAPGEADHVTFDFTLTNTGGAPSPRMRWTMFYDDLAIAAGDTAIGARDSVSIAVEAPAALSAGVHSLRIVADSLDQAIEVDEANNALVRALLVVPGSGPDHTPPWIEAIALAEVQGVFARVHWKTNEPATGLVRFGTTLPGDSAVVTAPPDTVQTVTLWGLKLGTRYVYQVVAIDPSGNRTEAPADSFVTRTGPLDAPSVLPATLELSNVSPNPTTGIAQLLLALPRSAHVQFQIFDVLGREVWRAPSASLQAGRWPLRWTGLHSDGRRVSPGVFLARVRVDGLVLLRRIAIVR